MPPGSSTALAPIKSVHREVVPLESSVPANEPSAGEHSHSQRRRAEECQPPPGRSSRWASGTHTTGSHQIAAPYSEIAKSNQRVGVWDGLGVAVHHGQVDAVFGREAPGRDQLRRRVVDPRPGSRRLSTPTRTRCRTRARWHPSPAMSSGHEAGQGRACPDAPGRILSLPARVRRTTIQRGRRRPSGRGRRARAPAGCSVRRRDPDIGPPYGVSKCGPSERGDQAMRRAASSTGPPRSGWRTAAIVSTPVTARPGPHDEASASSAHTCAPSGSSRRGRPPRSNSAAPSRRKAARGDQHDFGTTVT